MYVKNEFYTNGEAPEKSVDIQLAIKLKKKTNASKPKSTNTLIPIVGAQINQYYTTL